MSSARRGEWIVGIQDALRWLGLDWDEGPFLQSDRLDQYAAAAGRLLASPGGRTSASARRRRSRSAATRR